VTDAAIIELAPLIGSGRRAGPPAGLRLATTGVIASRRHRRGRYGYANRRRGR